MQLKSKNVIAVVGPTAVGKTSCGIRLAEHFQTEILSADSRQCYRELNIGVARPSDEELQQVPHHFIASHSIHEDLTAADYETYALNSSAQFFQEKNQLILVGGTGLYIKAFASGLDPIPEVAPAIRQQVIGLYAEKGIHGLQAELIRLDPEFAQEGEMQNPQRMMRALEVMITTGMSIVAYRSGSDKTRPFGIRWVGLELPREELIRRIDERVETMMQNGLLQEVQALYAHRTLNALQTVGYRELFDHLSGRCSLDEAVERIKISTRQYAKRQMTWFRKVPDMHWFHPSDETGILKFLEGVN
ncbi:MAG: tRNA ((37)-N6)-dimethylallyltransferase MiaA [Bacteroidota bacterium]